ncbi:MAG TPA: GTPase [Candidatus Nanoarchaeia archaeon]|nr:GTPase [Candidatus Nanoarchaeia archaeon]
MKNFWEIVNKVIHECDIILLVMDARFPELTYNQEIKEKAGTKPVIYVLNKADLAQKSELIKWKRKHRNAVFISATKRLGTGMLRTKILEVARGEKVRIGVVGYPNTGKSSLINALRGRHVAPTSSASGFTKGKQYIRISENIMIYDTPGVLPYMEKDKVKLAMIGAEDFTKVKDADLVVLELIKQHKKIMCKYYKVPEDDQEKVLESIAERYHKRAKGGVLDLNAMARMILKDWQRGKIIDSH